MNRYHQILEIFLASYLLKELFPEFVSIAATFLLSPDLIMQMSTGFLKELCAETLSFSSDIILAEVM